MIKRIFDICASAIGLLFLLPFLLLLSVLIALDSNGGVFYKQIRVGKNNIDFGLFKFRTMRPQSDNKGLITIGNRDPRITRIGYYLRKYKLDELPQLINVLLGDMSIVGPRPEVRKYVSMYTTEQLRVLTVRPGITDLASIAYFDENELLAKSTNPHKDYIELIMPAKLTLNLQYITTQSFATDVKIILNTLAKIIR
ncbi:MAG: sugar transferase [Bacteroidia bacterium]|nr:sugar transferase [Bacteroidia bacterium]